MAEDNGIYKCEVSGNVVSVLEASGGELVCCGKPMALQEKHFIVGSLMCLKNIENMFKIL